MRTATELHTPEVDTEGNHGHIGRIVVGCVLAGLVAAIALVGGPLAGATEHIITGWVLITFGVAWGMLAFLSQRWTNQPQRWAIVPAVFLGGTGAIIVVVAPTGTQLGGVGQPGGAVLTMWMVVQSRRTLRSHTRAWVKFLVCADLLFSAFGRAYET